MKIFLLSVIALIGLAPMAHAEKKTWRAATDTELSSLLPARAPVIKEHIETEMRTATGIVDNHGHYIAAVVLITAGYSADGKYSHYLVVQEPIKVGGVLLKPGEYVLGWTRDGESLKVHFNLAATGDLVGSAEAHRMNGQIRVESIRIWPPNDRTIVQIGRFSIPYELVD
ncbi:MAG TPA: hypothetical protein VG844_07240 [Terracidiphilus sp.]|nr:hypothetical protein [Terracidiphilus sp.]